jgi:hypothetical protein
MHPDHPDDTLFVVFESDFRWYQEDDLSPDAWTQLAMTPPDVSATPVSTANPLQPLGSSSTGAHRPVASSSGPQRSESRPDFENLGEVLGARQSVKPYSDSTSVSAELFELVCAVNIAARQGRGEVVWASWNASQQKTCKKHANLMFGSQLVTYTKAAASRLVMLMQKTKPQHYDLWLKDTLMWCHAGSAAIGQPAADILMKASYIVPPLGGFAAHKSPNCDDAVRTSLFDATWARPGSVSIALPSDAPRQLYRFGAKGKGEPIATLPKSFPNADHFWRTQHPPPSTDRACKVFQDLLETLKFLDADGCYAGPPYQKGEGWQRTKRGQWHWVQHPQNKQLREAPDSKADGVADSVMGLSYLGKKVCIRRVQDDQSQWTAREYRRYRQILALHARRFFCSYDAEAFCFQHYFDILNAGRF